MTSNPYNPHTSLHFSVPSSTAQLVVSPENASVLVGDTVYFTCVGYGGEVETLITWMKGNMELVEDTRLNISSSLMTEGGLPFVVSILEICSVEVGDAGTYSCTADNGLGNETSYFFLTVTPVAGICRICILVNNCFQSIAFYVFHRPSSDRHCS